MGLAASGRGGRHAGEAHASRQLRQEVSADMTRRDLGAAAIFGLGSGLRVFAQAVRQAERTAMDKISMPDRLTDYVAEFIVNAHYDDIPAEVAELSKKSVLDGLGLALCGSVAQSGEIVRNYLTSSGLVSIGSRTATVIGSALRTPVRFAAFANAIGIHADDYDDTQLAVAEDRVYGLLTHPTAPVLPAALAAAETRSMSGKELMLAYNVGVEVECKIAEAIAPRHYEDGFHTTGTVGTLGATAAMAKIYGFDRAHAVIALGIGASEAAGLRENFGTMTKPFHAGRAAESGVVAADFAALGWTAADSILEAPRGFFHAAGGGFDSAAIAGKLGNPWTFVSPGVSIKPFPSGSLTHPGMTAMLSLIREHQITADSVEHVRIGTNRNSPNALIYHQPKDSLQAKFSMEFCMAVLLLYGRAGLGEFNHELVNRPEVRQMIGRIEFGVDPVAEAAGYNKMTTIIEIKLKDGRTISGRADVAKGNPANPMSYAEVAAKFLDCANFAKWPMAKAKAIVEMVRGIGQLADVRALTALCAKP
jgi:2-methylcitrate dehydratase PrpD